MYNKYNDITIWEEDRDVDQILMEYEDDKKKNNSIT